MDEKRLIDMLEEFDARRNQIKELEELNKKLKNEIYLEVGSETAQVGRFEISTYASLRFQQAKFKEDYPEWYDMYCDYGNPTTYVKALYEKENVNNEED